MCVMHEWENSFSFKTTAVGLLSSKYVLVIEKVMKHCTKYAPGLTFLNKLQGSNLKY